jgi:hypothetical protein
MEAKIGKTTRVGRELGDKRTENTILLGSKLPYKPGSVISANHTHSLKLGFELLNFCSRSFSGLYFHTFLALRCSLRTPLFPTRRITLDL